ncbi:antibiotic biosynthesis monooxygenase family protein [Phycicoccus avicenniae]|uniref:antibiotic biosynthesis monooxygenase family protein n=1 Tax=Phycicoccus avicenniae TaxID=2828860 RepID=UPI003D2BA345
MICVQFVFRPGTYDEVFHRLDGEIDEYARSLPGFVRTETWTMPDQGLVNAIYYFTDQQALAHLARFPAHREAKGQVRRWYEAHHVVVTEVKATYGDGPLTG